MTNPFPDGYYTKLTAIEADIALIREELELLTKLIATDAEKSQCANGELSLLGLLRYEPANAGESVLQHILTGKLNDDTINCNP